MESSFASCAAPRSEQATLKPASLTFSSRGFNSFSSLSWVIRGILKTSSTLSAFKSSSFSAFSGAISSSNLEIGMYIISAPAIAALRVKKFHLLQRSGGVSLKPVLFGSCWLQRCFLFYFLPSLLLALLMFGAFRNVQMVEICQIRVFLFFFVRTEGLFQQEVCSLSPCILQHANRNEDIFVSFN